MTRSLRSSFASLFLPPGSHDPSNVVEAVTMNNNGTVIFKSQVSTTRTASQMKEDIVEKLHGALANLRRERDEAHRQKQLALERLRLVTEERETMEKNVSTMKQNLSKLLEKSDQKARDEIAELQAEVERLDREVRFQHDELLAKREKVSRRTASIARDGKKRDATLVRTRELLRKRREKAQMNVEVLPNDEALANVSLLSRAEDATEVWLKWPKVIEQSAVSVTMEAADVHRECEILRRRIAGYQNHLGVTKQAPIPVDESTLPVKESPVPMVLEPALPTDTPRRPALEYIPGQNM